MFKWILKKNEKVTRRRVQVLIGKTNNNMNKRKENKQNTIQRNKDKTLQKPIFFSKLGTLPLVSVKK